MKKGIIAVLAMLTGGAVGAITVSSKLKKKVSIKDDYLAKMSEFYHLMNHWLILKQEGKFLSDFFKRNGYQSVAIYGMKELGERLYEELKGTDIKVEYAIDKRAKEVCVELDVMSPEEELRKVDVIVVTAIHFFDEIEHTLGSKVNCPIISLEEVIYGI